MTKSLFALVGMKHRGTEALVASLPQGEPLTLVREPMNQYDSNAVQVWARGQHVGYCKASQVRPLALLMDRRDRERSLAAFDETSPPREPPSNYTLAARLAIDGGKWPMIEVSE